MVNYRRNKTGNPDDYYFLTIVTASRSCWIADLQLYALILSEMKQLTRLMQFQFKAWVILPDHLHWLVKPRENDYSNIVSAFKRGIGAELKRAGAIKKGSKMWQDRFWEETIRDEDHFTSCVEYIHYNPVKHGLVQSPRAWRYSSFRGYVKRGLYPADWAEDADIQIEGAEFD